jgi:hypothetical protein
LGGGARVINVSLFVLKFMKGERYTLVICLIIFTSDIVYAQAKLPTEFIKTYNNLKLNEKYQINGFIKPYYLESDFNKDGIKDIAALVVEKNSKKRGILLIHGGSHQYFIFGAGTKFGNGSDDFKWLKGWSLYNSKIAYESTFSKDGDILGSKKIKIVRPAFYIYDLEDGEPNSGGIIYWTGKKYIWISQGE